MTRDRIVSGILIFGGYALLAYAVGRYALAVMGLHFVVAGTLGNRRDVL